MIFFFGDGKLGNQLFQLAFLLHFNKDKKVIYSTNFKEVYSLFNIVNIDFLVNIENKFFKKISLELLNPIFKLLSFLRIVSCIKLDSNIILGTNVETKKIISTKGILPIIFIYPNFFQSEFFFNKKFINNFKIKRTHTLKAKNFLKKLNNYELVFVHIRRTDYQYERIVGKIGANLPLKYYTSTINWFKKNIKNPFFIFLSDDIEFVKKNFSYIEKKIISYNDMYVDFSIITLCKFGIIANSSFSWWASFFNKNKKIIFAPKYWLGWKSKVEVQEGTLPSYARIVDPNNPKIINIK
jgi:hypothetical protein